jgi:serine/threonine-protein kinase
MFMGAAAKLWAAMATPLPAVSDVPRRSTRPGGVEDRYRSLFIIGRGGMGNVEVALERGGGGFERFERVVALKTLLPEGARDPRHKEMFLREARLAALLKHPNVVHAFAFGELFGELFLAMEYVEGEPLSRVLGAARAVDPSRALDPAIVSFVLAAACDGLHAAHELRDVGGHALHVVHRDVSPQNVMIAYDGHVKILDFGVAKFDTGGHETRTGEVKGKMAYMSPEQALGEKLDRRSDLFSVGAVLFECLTGRRMWGDGTDMEVMRKLALEQMPRLDEAMPSAPRPLVELHARLVARDPKNRPETARDVAAELRAFASSSPLAPDTAAVRALMHRLFALEAQRRRAQLTRALEQAAPNHVAAIREDFTRQSAADGTTSTEPVIVRTPAGAGSESTSDKKTSRAGLAAAMVAAVVVGAAVAAGAIQGSRGEPSSAAATNPAPSTPPAASASAPAASAISVAMSALPTATTMPKPLAAPRATAPDRAAPPRPSPTQRSRSRPEPRTSAPKLPDVDPTPF